MLGNLKHEPAVFVTDLERVLNGWQIAVETNVDDGSDNLGDSAF
jgi:hypothetical protein